jgi:hypothetical protein
MTEGRRQKSEVGGQKGYGSRIAWKHSSVSLAFFADKSLNRLIRLPAIASSGEAGGCVAAGNPCQKYCQLEMVCG